MSTYEFDPADCFERIKSQFLAWMESISCKKVVLGISGGKDSTVCAWLLSKIIGPENAYGVMMPNGLQADIGDSLEVIRLTKINSYAINIANAYSAIVDQLNYNGLKPSADTVINMPPRLRMTALYAVAQTVGGIVLNTDNLDEIHLGYYTLFGDGAGSYGLLRNLTVTEVVELGKWLGIPEHLAMKRPGDGLQPQGDEERLGIKYADLDVLIRKDEAADEFRQKMMKRCSANKFKTDIVNIPAPAFGYPDYVKAMLR